MRRKRTAMVAGAMLAVALAAGISAALAIPAKRAASSGGSPAALLSQILSGFGDDFVTASSLTGKPASYQCSDGSGQANLQCATGEWLNLTVRASSADGPQVVRPVWEAELVAGALRQAVANAGGAPIYQLDLTAALPDGSVASPPIGGLGEARAGVTYASPADADLKNEVASGASKEGVTVRSVDVLHPAHPALALVLQTSDPSGFMQGINATLNAIVPNAADLEGLYIEVDDAAGTPFYVSSYAQSGGAGHRWIRPGLNQSGPVPPNAG